MNDSEKSPVLSRLFQELPKSVSYLMPGRWLVDFGRVAFGNLRIQLPAGLSRQLRVHFGEASANGCIDRNPPGSVRYACVEIPLSGKAEEIVVAPNADERNTGPQAVALPTEWGVILPFRWVEIEGWPRTLDFDAACMRRQAAYAADWDENAASFESSNDMLNRIWELCRYTIKATTFAGIYVDGDRERIPYEADAYFSQIGHYACDPHPAMARATFDHLMKAPTWPTEWASHMVFMAHADWMYTGDTQWFGARYEALKAKLLPGRGRSDGLITSTAEQMKLDLVDWPPAERDGYEFTAVNTVVNAFQYRALVQMSSLARALGKADEAGEFKFRAEALAAAYQSAFFDSERGIYRDGETCEHASQHANLFSLAFGIVPEAHRANVLAFVKEKAMACSVYPAQYLLEALFLNGEAEFALSVIMAPGKRSWRHMVESGTTLTWEAWDQIFKPNQDWNHAWGAAPANILPRFVLGVEPLEPGFGKVSIQPKLGCLSWARGVVPTLRGPVHVYARKVPSGEVELDVKAPEGIEISVGNCVQQTGCAL